MTGTQALKLSLEDQALHLLQGKKFHEEEKLHENAVKLLMSSLRCNALDLRNKQQLQGLKAPYGLPLQLIHLEDCDLTECELKECDLTNGHCADTIFEKAHLQKAILRRAELIRAKLAGSHLQGATLSDAKCQKADFTGADLTDAKLYGADITGTSFCNANLRGADLRHVTYKDSLFGKEEPNFRGADIEGAQIGWSLKRLIQKQNTKQFKQ